MIGWPELVEGEIHAAAIDADRQDPVRPPAEEWPRMLSGWGATNLVKAKKRLAQAETEYEAKRGVAEQAVEHSNATN